MYRNILYPFKIIFSRHLRIKTIQILNKFKLRIDRPVIRSELPPRMRLGHKIRWIAETFSREGQPNSEGDFRSALEFITQFKFQLGVRKVG